MQDRAVCYPCQKLTSQQLQEDSLRLRELEPKYSSYHLEDQRANWVVTKPGSYEFRRVLGLACSARQDDLISVTMLNHEIGYLKDSFFGRTLSGHIQAINYILTNFSPSDFENLHSEGHLDVWGRFSEMWLSWL